MGDDSASTINDLPQVTSILSSELISNTEAFDMMTRFLSKHQFRYSNYYNYNNNDDGLEPQQQQQQQQRLGPIYHFWEDLYNVTETLVVDQSSNSRLYAEQHETLRKLRLVAAPLHNNNNNDVVVVHPDTTTGAIKEDINETIVKTNVVTVEPRVAVKEELIVKQEEEDVDEKQRRKENRKSLKKEKKEKKKEKKRKRDSDSSDR